MPLTLPPVSRRRFLASSLAAGAGLLVSTRWLRADAGGARDPDRLVLFSDIHISADPAHVERKVNMTDHLRQAIAEALELDRSDRRPSGAIVNGDCAFNHGLSEDYASVVKLLAPLQQAGLPVHLALGNHDNRDRFREAIPVDALAGHAEERPLEDRQVLVLKSPRVDWVLLDSLEKTNSTPGLLGEEQIHWLAQTLDAPERKEKPVIVMVHHNPEMKQTEGMAGKISGLKDTKPLMDVILPRKQVKALLFGHTHVWSHEQVDGLHLVNLPAVAYVFRPEQPSAWVDCTVDEAGAKMELRCLDPKHPKNRELLDLRWRA